MVGAYPHAARPRRIQVLEALRSALVEGINRKNGASYHDLGGRVYIYEGERLVLGEESPFIILAPFDRDAVQELSCWTVRCWMYVQAVLAIRVLPNERTPVGQTPQWLVELEYLITDVLRVIESDKQLGQTVLYVESDGNEVHELGASSKVAHAQVSMTICYDRRLGDPSQ